MSYFTKDFLAFFKELTESNDRDWFQANKKRFESHVKKPFEAFVDEMIRRLKKVEPGLNIETKDAVFRIFRDVRFSADKSPYKTHMAAIVSRGGRKDHSVPGMYLHLGADEAWLYSGVYEPDKEQLQRIREYIASNLKSFDKLVLDKEFRKKFGEIQGEKNKRIPPELAEVAKKQPLIANKGFYYHAKFPAKSILDPKFPDVLMNTYKAAAPLNKFFTKAMGKGSQ